MKGRSILFLKITLICFFHKKTQKATKSHEKTRKATKRHEKTRPSNRNNINKFVAITNKYLKIFAKPYNVNVSSHFFRVGFVTKSLKYTDPHNAQKLVGHFEIRKYMKYNRYQLDLKDTIKKANY